MVSILKFIYVSFELKIRDDTGYADSTEHKIRPRSITI